MDERQVEFARREKTRLHRFNACRTHLLVLVEEFGQQFEAHQLFGVIEDAEVVNVLLIFQHTQEDEPMNKREASNEDHELSEQSRRRRELTCRIVSAVIASAAAIRVCPQTHTRDKIT